MWTDAPCVWCFVVRVPHSLVVPGALFETMQGGPAPQKRCELSPLGGKRHLLPHGNSGYRQLVVLAWLLAAMESALHPVRSAQWKMAKLLKCACDGKITLDL